MTEIENEIDALVRAFVAQLSALFARSMSATFERAVMTATGRLTSPVSVASNRASAPPASRKPEPAPKTRTRSTTSRGDVEVESGLSTHLVANPGQRMDQLSKSLGTPVPKLQKAIAKLMAGGAVRREGVKRGIRYYVGA